MLSNREAGYHAEPSPGDVIRYIEALALELADLASKHGRTALAASLSIVAMQAAGELKPTSTEG